MGLALGFSPRDKFYVDDVVVEVLDIDYLHATLKVNGTTFDVDDMKSVEILPQVFVSMGLPSLDRIHKHQEVVEDYLAKKAAGREPTNPGRLLPRLLIEAPRSVTVLREELYLKGKREGDRP